MSAWIEIAIQVDEEAADTIAEVLTRYGHQGIAIERIEESEIGLLDAWEDEIPRPRHLIVKAYMPADEHAPDKQQQIRDALRYMNALIEIPEPVFRSLEETDWEDVWKVHYKPLRFGRRIYIRPSWIEVDDVAENDILITLDPGMAFGTGTHPTTQLCLLTAEDLLEANPGWNVLDLGCGSGILSIAAIKLGAKQVYALDTDNLAVKVTLENAALNTVADQIHVERGSLETLLQSQQQFDLAMVNILAKVIIAMCADGLGQVIRPGGVGIFSGIIQDQAADVEVALQQTGLIPRKQRHLNEWVVIEAWRP